MSAKDPMRLRIASAVAASLFIHWAARCSSRRSSTSATTRAIRSRSPASGVCTPAATTRYMPTAERSTIGQGRADGRELSRGWAWAGLAAVLVGGLALRLWGVAQGLPYAYNSDEADHFVPRAVRMFGGGLNPHYFANPPGFTYLLHYLFAVAYGGESGVRRMFASDPQDVYTLARVAAAVL